MFWCLVEQKHNYQKTLLWSTKNKLNITENVFQNIIFNKPSQLYSTPKKIFPFSFQSDIQTRKTSMFSRKKFPKMSIFFFFGQNKWSVNITKEIYTHTHKAKLIYNILGSPINLKHMLY